MLSPSWGAIWTAWTCQAPPKKLFAWVCTSQAQDVLLASGKSKGAAKGEEELVGEQKGGLECVLQR